MLAVTNLCVNIGGSPILNGVGFTVGAGEFVCILGRNGSGKTTTFRTIMGYRKPAAGEIRFDGRVITGLATWRRAQAGIGFSPEESEVFGDLKVDDNIRLPTWTNPRSTRSAEERVSLAYDIFPKLLRYKERGGMQLSGGERKMVSVARAVALDPKLLLLDEPFEGLSPVVIPDIANGISSIRKLGCSILQAESNIHHVPENVDRVYVLERGEVIFSGSRTDALCDASLLAVISG